jgi:hypothetical protein
MRKTKRRLSDAREAFVRPMYVSISLILFLSLSFFFFVCWCMFLGFPFLFLVLFSFGLPLSCFVLYFLVRSSVAIQECFAAALVFRHSFCPMLLGLF